MCNAYLLCFVLFRWYEWWEKSKYFVADASSTKPPFVIVSLFLSFIMMPCEVNLVSVFLLPELKKLEF